MGKREQEDLSEAEIPRRSDARRARLANTFTKDGDEDVYFTPHFGYKSEYSSNMRPWQINPECGYKDGPEQLAYKPSYQCGSGAGHSSNQNGYGPTQSASQVKLRPSLGAYPYKFGSCNGIQPLGSGAGLDNQFGQGECHDSNQIGYGPTQDARQSHFSSLRHQQSPSIVGYSNKQFGFESSNGVSQFSAGYNNDANLNKLQDQDASELFGLQPFQSPQKCNFAPVRGPQQFNFALFQARHQPQLAK